MLQSTKEGKEMLLRNVSIEYRGIIINKTKRYGRDWYEFVLNQAPYGVPTLEDCEELIDIMLS